MKRLVKRIIRNIVYGERASSERYINYLRSLGCKIGDDVSIYVCSDSNRN